MCYQSWSSLQIVRKRQLKTLVRERSEGKKGGDSELEVKREEEWCKALCRLREEERNFEDRKLEFELQERQERRSIQGRDENVGGRKEG